MMLCRDCNAWMDVEESLCPREPERERANFNCPISEARSRSDIILGMRINLVVLFILAAHSTLRLYVLGTLSQLCVHSEVINPEGIMLHKCVADLINSITQPQLIRQLILRIIRTPRRQRPG